MSTEIISDEQLAGTVKPYQRHVVVLTHRADWPSYLDQDSGVVGSFYKAVNAPQSRLGDVKVTAATGNSSNSGNDVLVFPDMIRYREVGADGTDSDVLRIIEEHLLGRKISKAIENEKLTGRHLFVCIHNARDIRCGTRGPDIADELESELLRGGFDDVVVYRSSHVGGHKFAGCLVSYPSGDWYGRLTPGIISQFVEHCIARGCVFDTCWRGRMEQ